MPETTFIYALKCPVSGEIRYVGKSNDPETRYKKHCSPSTNERKRKWIMWLRSQGRRPELIVLEEVPRAECKDAENAWIQFFLGTGCKLLNWIYRGYSNKQMLREYNAAMDE